MRERQSWWHIGYAGWKFCHPYSYSRSSKRKHCPCLCFRTLMFMLCEIHILSKVNLSCTVLCIPKQDHARSNRLPAPLCTLVACFPQGWVYQVAQALARSPWLQSSHPPASYTCTATIFIAKSCVHPLGRALECEKDCHTAPFMSGSGPGKWLIDIKWFSWHPW